VPVGIDAEVPLAHRFERGHYWMLFGLRCWSCSPYANNTPRMNRPAGTEKPRSWKATNDTTYPLGAWHGLVARNPPLDGIGEWRKGARLNKTGELFTGNIGARPIRHHGSKVLGGPKARAAALLRMWKNSECKGRVQEEEEEDGKAKSQTSARRAA
jgi:hypothetical protein